MENETLDQLHALLGHTLAKMQGSSQETMAGLARQATSLLEQIRKTERAQPEEPCLTSRLLDTFIALGEAQNARLASKDAAGLVAMADARVGVATLYLHLFGVTLE